MLTKERIEARAALRPLKQPIYDTGLILTAGVQRVQFFQIANCMGRIASGSCQNLLSFIHISRVAGLRKRISGR